MKIIKTDYGIASRVGETIYVNKRLSQDPILYEAVIKHEKSHTKGNTLVDFLLDLKFEFISPLRKRYYKFVLENPSSWVEFSPITFFHRKMQINLNLILFYIVLFLISFSIGAKWIF